MKFFATALLFFAGLTAPIMQAAPTPTPSPRAFRFPFSKPTPAPQPVSTPLPVSRPKPSPTSPPRAVPVPTPVVALPNYDEATSVRLQIFLDNHNFGPGKIDGRMGEFFRKALLSYKRANGMSTTGAVDASLLAEVPEAYTNWVIPPEAENFVGPVSGKPSEQAKLKALKYGSLLELVAERFHAAEDFLRKINPGMNLDQLKPGDTVKVPNVIPFKIEDLHEGFVPENPQLAGRKVCDRYARAFPRNPRRRQAHRRISDHAGLDDPAGADRHVEDPRHRDAALVSTRRRRPQWRSEDGQFLQPPRRPEQSGRRSLDGIEQTARRRPRDEQSRDDRSRRQPRLHSHRQLGRRADQGPRDQGLRGRDFLTCSERRIAAEKYFARIRRFARLGW